MATTPEEDDEHPVEPARSAEEVRTRHASNREAWNEAAGSYRRRLDQDIAALRAGKSTLRPQERANLGDLRAWCRRAIHLQCASGQDTLSLWLEGAAEVVGIDISDVHIENACRKGEALGAPATWYRCDVLEAPAALDGTADLVYTGGGAINWIQDLDSWARTVGRLLKPGGVLHLLDDHPFLCVFEADDGNLVLRDSSYLDAAVASKGWPASYIPELSGDTHGQSWKYEQQWPISAVVMAVQRAGLILDFLGEHREGYWDIFPGVPKSVLRNLPLTFSLMARKPAAK
ncbi:MAG: class I SAM-dependent methyltransferase [Planctomycetia bacterium]|nr:class I SAM-dependent methyltransferase [Planctomycetia bacterium]